MTCRSTAIQKWCTTRWRIGRRRIFWPLAGELIELEALSDETSKPSEPSGKRSLGHALTDNLGRFEITAPKLLLPTGAALLSAQVFPRRGHILPGRSPELALLVLPPEPISVLYFLLPLGVTG